MLYAQFLNSLNLENEECLHISKQFFNRILTTFFDLTAPASRNAKPHCMNITSAPMMRRKNWKCMIRIDVLLYRTPAFNRTTAVNDPSSCQPLIGHIELRILTLVKPHRTHQNFILILKIYDFIQEIASTGIMLVVILWSFKPENFFLNKDNFYSYKRYPFL